MPSQRYSWQQRCAVRAAVSKTALRRASLDLNAPAIFHGRISDTARTNSSWRRPVVTRSIRTKRNPVLPISRWPMNGMSITPSRIAWSFPAPRSPRSAIASATDSPNRMRAFMLRVPAAATPNWSPPCNSRPKSRRIDASLPPFSSTHPPGLRQPDSGTCPYFAPRSASAFVTFARALYLLASGAGLEVHTTRTGSTNVRTRGSTVSAAAHQQAAAARARDIPRSLISKAP